MKEDLVRVRGARVHNLKNVDVDIPREKLVVFTGISGSGKSSLAFGTLFAEAQRRYLESVAPYARRLIHQVGVPEVDSIEGLPPAVALQQQRGAPTVRSSVGSVTTLSSSLRLLYSRAGKYPRGQEHLEAEAFSPNTPAGACPKCHGLGRVYDVTEKSMVPDPSLTLRERAVAAWPPAWHGQNLRDMLTTLGHDIDVPWRDLPKKLRDWILFTDEQPRIPVYIGYDRHEAKAAAKRKEAPSYIGTFSSARRFVLHTFATTDSAIIKKRVQQYLVGGDCSECDGKKLKRASLSVKVAGLDIGELSRLTLKQLRQTLDDVRTDSPEKVLVVERITRDLRGRIDVLLRLGLGYLTLERTTPTLSPGELQRLRLATQIRSNLFGVVYVLDEPSAGLHPSDIEALLEALDALKAVGNSLFVVEHEIDVIRHADWIVELGPLAGEQGGEIVYNGPPKREKAVAVGRRAVRPPRGWLKIAGLTRNNLHDVDVALPIGVFTSVTGVSGSGKSSLMSQGLVELVAGALGATLDREEDEEIVTLDGRIVDGMQHISRLVRVDQKPIGRTPRSNLATYTGLFDHVRKLFADTKAAKAKRFDAGRFSFNVKKGRCETCEGEGFVMVELLFLPSVYAPCPTCEGARFNQQTLAVKYRDKNIAEVLGLTVDAARAFFEGEGAVVRALDALREVGLGYLRLGQPATELSGGEAQRIKLATELQRAERGKSLYVLDEPTTGLHPIDVEKLMRQLQRLVDAGNTVVVAEHDMSVVGASDWVIDVGPGAGDEGGRIVVAGTPEDVRASKQSKTARYL